MRGAGKRKDAKKNTRSLFSGIPTGKSDCDSSAFTLYKNTKLKVLFESALYFLLEPQLIDSPRRKLKKAISVDLVECLKIKGNYSSQSYYRYVCDSSFIAYKFSWPIFFLSV